MEVKIHMHMKVPCPFLAAEIFHAVDFSLFVYSEINVFKGEIVYLFVIMDLILLCLFYV